MATDGSGGPPRVPSVEDIESQKNIIEQLVEGVSPRDEYLEAIYRTNRALLDAQSGMSGLPSDERGTSVPVDSIGVAVEEINPGDNGFAVFQIQGTVFRAQVQNVDRETVTSGESVRVSGPGNEIKEAGASGGFSPLRDSSSADAFEYGGELRVAPNVISPEENIQVTNQEYARGEYNPVSASLAAGEKKTVAKIEVEKDEYLLFKATSATAHGTVKYNYYVDDRTSPDPDLSGSIPWATPPSLYEPVDDGFVLVEDFIELELVETSNNTQYSTVQGTLTAIKQEE